MASRRALVGLGVIAALQASVPAARADSTPSASERETARSLMTDGRDRRARNDLRGALTAFKAAHALMRVPTTGLEVARTEVALGLLVEARGTIRELFRVPSRSDEPRPFAEARAAALALDGELAARIPSIHVVLVNPGRDPRLKIDGVAIPAEAAAAPIKVDPGRHVVEASPGIGAARVELTIAEREDKPVTLTLPLPRPESPLADTESPSAPAPQSHTARTMAIAGFAAGGAGAIVGFDHRAPLDSKDERRQSLVQRRPVPELVGERFHGARSMATVSTLAFVVAGLGVGVGVGALLIGDKHAETAAKAQVTPWIGLGAAGLRGTF